MHTISGKVLFQCDANYFLIMDYAHAIVGDAVDANGQPDANGYWTAMRHNGEQMIPCFLIEPIAEKQIFAAISRKAQFGETQNVDSIFFRFRDSSNDVWNIVGPIDGSLVYGGPAKSESSIQVIIFYKDSITKQVAGLDSCSEKLILHQSWQLAIDNFDE